MNKIFASLDLMLHQCINKQDVQCKLVSKCSRCRYYNEYARKNPDYTCFLEVQKVKILTLMNNMVKEGLYNV